jgi:hypothetical protein
MANKILKFDIEPDYDFILFALISPFKDYKLACHINDVLEIDFCKNDDLTLCQPKKEDRLVSNFLYRSEHSTWCLFRNQLLDTEEETKGYLVTELKNYDFLLKIEGDSAEEVSKDLPEKLKSLPCVEYLTKIDVQNLKSKDNLLF